jgi:hypothetical protein
MALHYFYPKIALIVFLSLINANFVQSSPLTIHPLRAGAKQARSDPCLAVQGGFCQNGGLCYVDTADKFACHCPYGYIGTYCELKSLCLLPYCSNDGICKEGATPTDLPTCTCKPGWTDPRCQTADTTTTTTTTTTPTTPSPPGSLCAKLGATYCNTGTCTEVNGSQRCECPPAYSGNRCEISSGGTATPGPSTITPPTNFPPTDSSSIAPGQYITCDQAPCSNRGTCFNTGNTYFCLCYPGYTGTNCMGSG